MINSWTLKTHGDPVKATRKFLRDLWSQAKLDGMLVPSYYPRAALIKPYLLESPDRLVSADPFAPLTTSSAAQRVAMLARQRPEAHLGAVLRPCEVRALQQIIKRGAVPIKNWLLIGVDCLATYAADDYTWRMQKSGDAEQLTRKGLLFARQGGIAPYRYRPSCQMCTQFYTQQVDINIGLLGLPVKQVMFITARDDKTARLLDLPHLTDGKADPILVLQRKRLLVRLRERRQRTQERLFQRIAPGMPDDVPGIIAFLDNCSPCQHCLQICPIYDGELEPLQMGRSVSEAAVASWLGACARCGLCEDACPKHIPLTAVIGRIIKARASNPMAA